MGVPYLGVLIIRILLFRVLYWGPLCLETPILLMDKILHDPKDPKLWELWYIPEKMGNAGFCPSAVSSTVWSPSASLESPR